MVWVTIGKNPATMVKVHKLFKLSFFYKYMSFMKKYSFKIFQSFIIELFFGTLCSLAIVAEKVHVESVGEPESKAGPF